MAKKVEVSYNPQLGYLETVFRHDFDFSTGVRSYEVRSCGVDFEVETYHMNRAVVTIDLVGAGAVRFQMFPYGIRTASAMRCLPLPGRRRCRSRRRRSLSALAVSSWRCGEKASLGGQLLL